ncbi:MAG: DUF4491 family protein [Bacteroidales bacterium]|jgi:hypothetical protein
MSDWIQMINWQGLLTGLAAFFTIGLFHPLVVKVEYYWSRKAWPVFMIPGLIAVVASLFVFHNFWSIFLGVLGFSSFWSVLELIKQHDRVKKGQARANPKRTYVLLLPAIIVFCNLNFSGLVVGFATFIIISKARYLTIVAEYYFTKKFWIGFLILGLGLVILAAFTEHAELSAILAITGFTYLWGIGEIIEQEERVEKGWFPKNPKRT